MVTELAAAIDDGDLGRCRALILARHVRDRASVGLPDHSTLDVLQLAVLHDDAAARQLIATGLECDLHSASGLGLVEVIGRLANDEALSTTAEHLTPMGFALAMGSLEGVRALLAAGDDPNRQLARIGFFVWEMDALAAGYDRWRPLHGACAHGYAEDAAAIVTALIESGADIEATCPLGEQPLHLAATYGWMPVLETLLAAGARVDSRSAPVARALWRMVAPSHLEPVHNQTPLMVAVREGRLDAAKRLLRAGADLDARDSAGCTPLHLAARPWWREEVALVSILIDAGADPQARDAEGRTPAQVAEAAGHAESARLILSAR